MKGLSLVCLSLLFCGALQADQDEAIMKGAWFTGPVGPTGPQGPQGEKGQRGPKGTPGEPGPGFTSAHGYAFLQLDTDQPVSIQERVSFALPGEGSLYNMTWNDTDKQFQIQQPGVYEISYFVHCFTDMKKDQSTSLQVSLLHGPEASSICFVSLFYPAIQPALIGDCETYGTTLVRLNAGDFVALELKKTNPDYALPIYWQSKGIACSLSLKRISE